MGTKYSVNRSKVWEWVHEKGNPRFTQHSLERWDERTPDCSFSPESAWRHAQKLEYISPKFFRDKGGQDPEEVWYYNGRTRNDIQYEVLFLVRDNTVITIYPTCWIDHKGIRGYLDSIRMNNWTHE